jgi:thiol-disulfide isomerase/thioredoxin
MATAPPFASKIQSTLKLKRLVLTPVALLAGVIAATRADAAGIAWHQNFEEAARQSALQHKPMLVMVKARWCGPCHKMLKETFPDPGLAARISRHFIPVLIDSDEQGAVARSLGIEAMPTVVVVTPARQIAGRFTGFQSAAQLDGQLAAYAPREAPPVTHFAFRPAPAPQPVQSPLASRAPSFLRRHAVAIAPVRPGQVAPRLPPWDTLAAAREFSQRPRGREVTRLELGPPAPALREVASPTPNPPD